MTPSSQLGEDTLENRRQRRARPLLRMALVVVGVSLAGVSAPGGATASLPTDAPPYREVVAPSNGQQPVGAMLLIHGGGWVESPSHVTALRPRAEGYAEQGWLVWNVDYRSGAEALGDVRGWYEALAAEFDGPICASGESAGGHMALLLAAYEEIDCVISEGGPTDLTRMPSWTDYLVDPAFGASRWEHSPLRFARDEPETLEETDILLGHHEQDSVVPIPQVTDFASEMGSRAELHVLRPGGAAFVHAAVDPIQLARYREAERRLLTRTAEPGLAEIAEGTLSVTGADGAASDIRVDSTAGGTISVSDPAGLRPGAGCELAGPTVVVCDSGEVSSVEVRGGDRDDTIVGTGPLPSSLHGDSGNDRLSGGSGPDRLAGGPGVDTADYKNRTVPLAVSLDDQPNDGRSGEGDRVGTDFEWVYGGSKDDKLVGSAAPEAIFGEGGHDTIDGGAGGDWLNGGVGTDTADYRNRSLPLSVSLDGKPNDGQAGEGDHVSGDFEWLYGGSKDDKLVGSAAPEAIFGQAGNDTIDGGAGGDWLNGGAGVDTADYRNRTAPLAISLDNRSDDGQSGEGDLVGTDFEWLYGGSNDDKLVGSAVPEAIFGQGGNDTIDGGAGGDWLNGGAGTDTADYATRTAPLAVSLDDKPNDGQPGESDHVSGDFETLVGGDGADALRGGSRSDRLHGRGGADVLEGLGGTDELLGGAGDDQIRSRDLLVDDVACEAGEDALVGDLLDRLLGGGCELLDLI